MAEPKAKKAGRGQTSVDTGTGQGPKTADVIDTGGNARDREMGRGTPPLGDLGGGQRTWAPPSGEQGISNRPDDAGATKSLPRNREKKAGDGG